MIDLFDEETPKKGDDFDFNSVTEIKSDDLKNARAKIRRIEKVSDSVKSGFQLFYQVIAEDNFGNVFLSRKPVLMKNITEPLDSIEKKDFSGAKFEWIFPVSLLLNILLLLIAAYFNVTVSFLAMLFFNVVLLAAIFIAGQNFWLWFSFAVFKKKPWHFKIKSFVTGRDEFTYSPVKEAEVFKYKDQGGVIREAEVTTRSSRFFSNLGARYTIYREGYPDSIDIHEQYPVSKINRDINQTIIGAKLAGALWVIDKYLGLVGKDNKDKLIYILIIIVLVGVLMSVYYGYTNLDAITKGFESIATSISSLATTPGSSIRPGR